MAERLICGAVGWSEEGKVKDGEKRKGLNSRMLEVSSEMELRKWREIDYVRLSDREGEKYR